MSRNNNNIQFTEEETLLCFPKTFALFTSGTANTGAEDIRMDDVFRGNSPLTAANSSSVNSAPAPSSNASSRNASSVFADSMVPPLGSLGSAAASPDQVDDDFTEEMMIAELMEEKKQLFKAYRFHRANRNFTESDKALAGTKRTASEIEALRSLSSEGFSSAEPKKQVTELQKKPVFEGPKLPRSDIPKFRLVSSQYPLYGKAEVFESDLHFMNTFESVLASSSTDLESSWRLVFPLCFDHTHTAWVNTELKGCQSWKVAKIAFHKQFGSRHNTTNHVNEVWTMSMKPKETISEYTRRFGQQVYLAKMTDERNADNLAQRFLASLLPPEIF